jgi:hypothetical protein
VKFHLREVYGKLHGSFTLKLQANIRP